MLGYALYPQDNGSHMDPNKTAPACPVCSFRLDPHVHVDDYRAPRNRRDVVSTFDGQSIVSQRFREIWESKQLTGAKFEGFSTGAQWWQLTSSERVPFDRNVKGLRLLRLCSQCGQYEFAGGMEVRRLLIDELPADLCETDLAFASGNEKFRLQVFSPRAVACLEAEKLRGLSFEPVYGRAEGSEP
jgi:hypothetical protein